LDLLDSGVIAFDNTSLVVLDEADKMLSVGFEPQLQRLKAVLLDSKAAAGQTEASTGPVSKKKSKKQKQETAAASTAAGQHCQVLLFSATLPKAVRVTADVWLKAGYKSVSCSAGADAISHTITQVSGLTMEGPGCYSGGRSFGPWAITGMVGPL
jgi:superfamily II DNA/RNA helicase